MLTLQTAANESQREDMKRLKEQEAELLVSCSTIILPHPSTTQHYAYCNSLMLLIALSSSKDIYHSICSGLVRWNMNEYKN